MDQKQSKSWGYLTLASTNLKNYLMQNIKNIIDFSDHILKSSGKIPIQADIW